MDQPDSVTGVVVLVLLVLPGAAFTWSLERQVGAYGVSFADRVLRFTGVSAVFHLVLAPLDFLGLRLLRSSTSSRESHSFGGHSGSTPAARMPPPARIPSSFTKPVKSRPAHAVTDRTG